MTAESSIVIRPMVGSDLEAIMEIERSAYPIPWNRAVFEDCIANKRNDCWIAENEGAVCGYAILTHVLDETHLLNFCIAPAHSRKGLGRSMLRILVAKALENGARSFFLEVRVSNHKAISLYLSEGFNEVGVRPNYYPAENGREDALLMTLELAIDQYV